MKLKGGQPNWSCGERRNHYSTHHPPSFGNQLEQKLRIAAAQTSLNTRETIMTITTRLTRRFRIKHPIVLAPMTPASGGALASAVAAAGGLGLLGGGYVDRVWFEAESAKVTRSDVGAGFITWTIPEDPGLLDIALERHPRAMMLSFSDPGPYAARIKKAGVPLICQVHSLRSARSISGRMSSSLRGPRPVGMAGRCVPRCHSFRQWWMRWPHGRPMFSCLPRVALPMAGVSRRRSCWEPTVC
jgi:hypothetical protein